MHSLALMNPWYMCMILASSVSLNTRHCFCVCFCAAASQFSYCSSLVAGTSRERLNTELL